MVTVSAAPQPNSGLKAESLMCIDLNTLSQSELRALSMASTTAFDLDNTDDVVVPRIDRSVFNESAGSRRQTYSRPRTRPVPRSPNSASTAGPGHRSRLAGLLPTAKPSSAAADDHERSENRSIVNHLKQLLGDDSNLNPADCPPMPDQMALVVSGSADFAVDRSEMATPVTVGTEGVQIVVSCGEKKRKRGRKPKVRVHGDVEVDLALEMVNKNGVVVDLDVLANAEDPYGEELRRRTAGLETEAELLGFLSDLGGQWGSRRKKRKIVDASEFGDALPVGWTLLVGIKRKVGRMSLYCRRYISPSGQQFVSCTEASSYLQAYFGLNEANLKMDQLGDNVQQPHKLFYGSHAGLAHTDENTKQDIAPLSMLPGASLPSEYEKEVSLLGIENLAEVQVQDLFECHKCDMIFDEKDAYLQHLLSSHQRTTRRYRLGTSVGDGVIVKDGKYECQFCHKVFDERRRYNGHVGIHVRNYVRGFDELNGRVDVRKSVDPLPRDGMPTRISKMDALIEIAQNSILETSTAGLVDEPKKLNVVPGINTPANADETRYPGSRMSMIGRTVLGLELNEQDSEHTMTDEELERIDDADNVVDSIKNSCLDSGNHNMSRSSETDRIDGMALTTDETDQLGSEQLRVCETGFLAPMVDHNIRVVGNNVHVASARASEVSEMEKHEKSVQELGFGLLNIEQNNSVVMEMVQPTSEGNVMKSGVSDTLLPLGNEFDGVDQKLDNAAGFEALRLDELEPLKFGFLPNDAEIEEGFDASVQFRPEEDMLNVAARHRLTTVCVWCRMEFTHETVDSEIQSDSVGFMCPTCKAKISGQLNVLDSGP